MEEEGAGLHLQVGACQARAATVPGDPPLLLFINAKSEQPLPYDWEHSTTGTHPLHPHSSHQIYHLVTHPGVGGVVRSFVPRHH